MKKWISLTLAMLLVMLPMTTLAVSAATLEVLFTDDSLTLVGNSMTVDLEAMAELSEEFMEAYLNGDVAVSWYVDGEQVDGRGVYGETLDLIEDYVDKYYDVEVTAGNLTIRDVGYYVGRPFVPFFTIQPVGGQTDYKTPVRVTWDTNFVPTAIELVEYDGNGNIAEIYTHIPAEATAYDIYTSVDPDGWFTLRAYHESGTYIESEAFYVTEPRTMHTVTFYFGESPIATQDVEEGYPASQPEDPAQEGMIFLGWYNGDELYDFSTPVTGDVHLVAKFQSAMEATVRGYVSGVKENTQVVIQLIEDGFTEPAYEVILNGCGEYAIEDVLYATYTMKVTAEGYNTMTETVIVEGDTIVDIGMISLKPTYDVLFYFDLSDEWPLFGFEVEEGDVANEPFEPAQEGKVFVGWYLDGAPYDFSTPVTKDLKLVAVFEDIAATLLGDMNGDGALNMMDALLLYSGISGGTLTEEQQEVADYNGDGMVNMMDALVLYTSVSGS